MTNATHENEPPNGEPETPKEVPELGATSTQRRSRRTAPSDPVVASLLNQVCGSCRDDLVILSLEAGIAESFGLRRARRIARRKMKKILSPVFDNTEWTGRTVQHKRDSVQSAWDELDDDTQRIVRRMFKQDDAEYAVLLGWILQVAFPMSAGDIT